MRSVYLFTQSNNKKKKRFPKYIFLPFVKLGLEEKEEIYADSKIKILF